MGLHLDALLERKCSGGLILAGPLVDHYIKEIGGGMLNTTWEVHSCTNDKQNQHPMANADQFDETH